MLVVSLIVMWSISSWLIAKANSIARKKSAVEQQTKLSEDRADDLADSIKRNLNFIDGIPDLVAQTVRVKNAVSRFGTDNTPSSRPLEFRKKYWTSDSELRGLSLYLHQVQSNLQVDLVYVVNAAGDCIAAGNLETPGSSIGTNFAERDFFKANRNNKPGMQYAVGKTTHIPGLFFSSPIFIKGHFMGAVVAKSDIRNLTSLIYQVNSFVTDANGVIILAHDKNRELLSLPGAPVSNIPVKERYDRYRKTDFPTLQIEPWGDRNFSSLMRIQDNANPHILMAKEIAGYNMKVYVDTEVADIRTINREIIGYAILLGMSGSILILIIGGTILYVDSIRTAESALSRAGIAERRIINISEETQQRIGRELHDDLGQHLTGIAFRSEILFQNLKMCGFSDSEEASKITALVNEAINKTRRLAQGLYPVEMKDAGLNSMLEQFTSNIESIYTIKSEFISKGECNISDPLMLISLFRITQEAVNNAIKHGGATKITIKVETTQTKMKLEIADNGRGIGNKAELVGLDIKGGIGMHTMHYRASLLGASFSIAERPEGGTSVIVTLPIA